MATERICSIPDCGKRAHRGYLCSMHAERKRKHGDPLKGAAKPRGGCTLEGCDRPHYGNGFCRAHWKRYKKYGSPTGGSTAWGEVRRWLDDVAVPYSGDNCLIFPYSRTPSGYGRINMRGKWVGAHVYVTLAVRGEKPSPQHEACHSCGNGHLGCVNPRHLRWGTRSDNILDAVRHGTWNRPVLKGERANASKFTDAQIAEVRALLSAGETQLQIAAKCGMSQSHISRIKQGQART